VPVRAGDAIFVPSGRVHGIGAGCVIFEIQQNSDTTYRVFDWNRVGLDGKPRDLHIPQSLRSIDFNDFEPGLIESGAGSGERGVGRSEVGGPEVQIRPLVSCDFFEVALCRIRGGEHWIPDRVSTIVAVVRGELRVAGKSSSIELQGGRFCLIPACLGSVALRSDTRAELLLIRPK
jgi:mannose-6-phosphate isomerase